MRIRGRGTGTVLAGAAILGCLLAPGAAAAAALKTVRYHGYRLSVPRSWPVLDLGKHPGVCTRFNRHAVYLGAPGGRERCPAQALGRTEAILIQAAPGRVGAAPTSSTSVPALIGSGGTTSGWLVNRRAGVLISASWLHRPGEIRRALGLRSLRPLLHAPGALPSGVSDSLPATAISARRGLAATPGGVYTGEGFDGCATPSLAAMADWHAAYRAIGVYIGGTNEASCAGKGLTPGWVSRESAAGWHLIPIYVGRQAASNTCGCQAIASAHAASEGRFAAKDAVSQARALGLGQGNPLYFDMENYTPGAGSTAPVLKFLGAWTAQVHAEGYLSGVYASGDSGVVDLVSQVATSYPEPDDLWMARWNDQDTTNDPNVPSGYWPFHERLHQDEGAHNETHGGVTINIDGDYLDGATAAAGTAPGAQAVPAATEPAQISGVPVLGRKLVLWHGAWSGIPSSYTDQWEDCNGSAVTCTPIPGATGQSYVIARSDLGHRIRVVEAASNAYGMGIAVASAATGQVLGGIPLYWIRNSFGNVYPSVGTPFFGSPFASGFRGRNITGATATLDGRGYWVVSARGEVFDFGDAARLAPVAHPRRIRIRGIVAAPGGGYWLYTRHGNVYSSTGAQWYGSPASAGFHGSTVTGMASTADGKGYWLVDSAGAVFPYGDAAVLPAISPAHSVIGLVAAPDGGYWLFTKHGNVYRSAGGNWYGSPAASGFHGSSITGMATSPDGKGYWLIDSHANVYRFGDAYDVLPVRHSHAVTGIFR
jgi:hypothetical protein